MFSQLVISNTGTSFYYFFWWTFGCTPHSLCHVSEYAICYFYPTKLPMTLSGTHEELNIVLHKVTLEV